jgi:methionine sulfoxide reductase heme-binding subunit
MQQRHGTISPKALIVAKVVVFILASLPFVRLAGAALFDWFGGLGANPIELLTRSTGTWTLVFLCITLAITPIRQISGIQTLQRMRRMFGLFTFFYVALHFTTYLWFDQWFDTKAIVADVIKRPFITAGFVAFVLLIPLAVTSTNAMMKRLGRRWAKLHKLIYLIAPLAIAHYWWHKSGKNATDEPIVYALIVALLLGYRCFTYWKATNALGQTKKAPILAPESRDASSRRP